MAPSATPPERPADTPTDRPAEPVSVPVTTADGTRFVLRVLPADDPAAPVVLVLPAMAMKAKFYRPLAVALHAAGTTAVTCDLRGHGESRPELTPTSRHGYREIVEIDLPAVVDAVAARFPDAPLHLLGHSLGGQVALLHTARRPDHVAGVVVVATGTVWFRAFGTLRRRLEVLGAVQLMGLLSWWRGHWPGGMVIPAPVAGGVLTDWARHSRTGRYRPAGSGVPYDRLLAAMERPVLSLSLVDDPLGPGETIDALAAKLRSASVSRRHLDAGAGVTHPGHFDWIRDSDAVAAAVTAWIAGRPAARSGTA